MADVIFYEKPGCQTNARQRRILVAAGHTVIARNLLTEPWSGVELRRFFGDAPVAAWFNPAAPRIKSGEVDPAALDAEAALALLLSEPLLIRRPLIEANGKRCTGFQDETVRTLLGREDDEDDASLEACSHKAGAPPCPEPASPSKAAN